VADPLAEPGIDQHRTFMHCLLSSCIRLSRPRPADVLDRHAVDLDGQLRVDEAAIAGDARGFGEWLAIFPRRVGQLVLTRMQ
jgi:hypothetical protein